MRLGLMGVCVLAIACGGAPLPVLVDASAGDAGDAQLTGTDASCTPSLSWDPKGFVFGTVAPGTLEQKTVAIHNQGDCALVVAKFTFVATTPDFTLNALGSLPDVQPSPAVVTLNPPIAIAPGAVLEVHVTFTASDNQPKTGTLTLFSNDPSQPNGTPIPLNANALAPCLKLTPTSVNFGGVMAAGGVDTRAVTVTSCGNAPVCLTSFSLSSSATPSEFSLDFTSMQGYCPTIDVKLGPTPNQPCCLNPGWSTTFAIQYAPTDVSPNDPNTPGQQIADTAEIQATSDAFPKAPPIQVTGVGVLQTCPIAKIDITEGDEVVPQTTLHLKGDGSKGTGGQPIKTYKWIAKQPAGSNKGFQPSSSFPNPTFVPDAAGEYEFCLDVTDANGVKSCAQTCQKVLVVPNNAVHVELLWDTPSDPDQTDVGPAAGADMDLHFANYNATKGPDIDCDTTPDPWFDNVYDCFWFNSLPQWGSANTAIKDDPDMDLDDSDGAGPENLNLEHPEGDPATPRYYSIGVHYWNDHGYGVSFSTITVYLFGAVALKIDKVSMNPLDMWYVGKLNWPNQLTGTSMPPLSVCYQTKGSVAGDVCKGSAQMWQGKGEWCVTPCYVNAAFAATTGGATPANCAGKP